MIRSKNWGKFISEPKNILGSLLFVFLFFFFSIIKLHNYDRIPGPAHGEELLYSWSGIHLIETGIPVSWSTLDYPKDNLVFEGVRGNPSNVFLPVKLYSPWLDEPPLYSLMAGGSAHLYGDNRDDVIPSSHSRIPSVLGSLVTMFLVFWVGYKFFGYWVGIGAMTFYGTSQIFVLGARLSVPENIIALGVVLSLLMAKKYLEAPKTILPVIWGFLIIILGLMKPTGYFLAPLVAFLAFKKKRWADVGIIVASTIIGIGLFVWYGWHFDGELFKYIVSIQGGRFAGWTGLGHVFTSPAYDIFETFDGWYIFALIFALFFAISPRKDKNISLMNLFFFYWLMVAVLSGTEQDLLPWYRYMTFPLLAIYGALGMRFIYKKPNFFGVALVVGLLLSTRWYLSNAFRPSTPPNTFRIIYFLTLVPSLFYVIYKKEFLNKLSRMIVILFFVIGAFLNSKYLYSIFEIRCESISCPFGKSTWLSEIKMPVLWRFLVVPPSTDMLTTKRPWL